MTREHELILELCKFIKPDSEKIKRLITEPLNFPCVLGQIIFHRMGGAAYHTLREGGLLGLVNREIRNALKIFHDSAAAKSVSMGIALSELAVAFNNVNFPFALLKGAYLISRYPAGLRTSNDIDILICQKNLTELENILKSQGFEQGNIRNGAFKPASRTEIISSRMNRGETVPFIKQVNLPEMKHLEIDINFSLDFKAKQETDIVPNLLNNTQPLIQTAQGILPVLSPTDFMIHLCCHLYKEASVYAWVAMSRDLSLYKFADIYLLLNLWSSVEFYQKLQNRIESLKLQKECYYALLYTCELFGIADDFARQFLNRIRPQDISYLKMVIWPEKNITYGYREDFTDWLFLSGRKERLYEIANENA